MTQFSLSEQDRINAAYQVALTRLENLRQSNQLRPSTIRDDSIDQLVAYQQQIENLGFFDKEDFSDQERQSILDAAGELTLAEGVLNDAHELTLMELEGDVIQLVHKLSLREFRFALRATWARSRGPFHLPEEIPEEVVDDFNVGVFRRVQGRFNQISIQVKQIVDLKSLNSDDYRPQEFDITSLNASFSSAVEATDNHIALKRLRDREAAESEANEVGIGGQIWAVIGWDSPSDFLKDMVITAVTGGASKIVRWGRNIGKLRSRINKAERALDRLLKTRERLTAMERRIEQIKSTAEKVKRAKNLVQSTQKIMTVFKTIEKAEEQLKLLNKVASEVTISYVRGVASTVTSRLTTGNPVRLGGALTNEAARQSIMAFLRGTPLSNQIEKLRGQINFGVLIVSGFGQKEQERFMAYLALLTAREFLVRATLAIVHKLTLSVELIVNELISSVASALETIMLDLPLLSESSVSELARTAIATVRKILVDIAQRLARKLLPA